MLILAFLVAAAPVRVYLAPLTAAEVDAATVALVQDRVLTAMEKHKARYDVVSSREVQTVMDAEAARQALGCDAESCAAEVADALAAPQLITGQLGRIGSTWQLALVRTDRASLRALARVHAEASGETPEQLLPKIPALVDGLFRESTAAAAPPSSSALAAAGAVALGVGGLGVVGGGVMVALAWQQYFVARDALARPSVQEQDLKIATDARDLGQVLAVAGWATVAAGGLLAGLGGAVLALALAGDAE